jgi:lipopolysaccharide heptosyltransferase III
VIHASPMFRYKQWTKDGWRKLAATLAGQGLAVIATGGSADDERRYLDNVWQDAGVTRFDGRLDWPQLAGLLAKARVYIGPDTSVTHLAAASGCPTVALFGPTDPRLWGPWPAGGREAPWDAAGTVQQRGNVFLVQHAFPCTPCQLEGCERRLGSHSACLDELSVARVIEASHRAMNLRISSN